MDDGSGRGKTVFASVDSIGISNADIRQIRQELSSFAQINNISSINIFSTHNHSGIDTQGLWTNLFGKLPLNLLDSITGLGERQPGTNPEYMAFFRAQVRKAIEDAVADMTSGSMKYAVKDIGENYFKNDRASSDALNTELKRLTFTPYDGSRPTIILNMEAHPSTAGLPTGEGANGHGVSGDYVYYIGEVLNGAGYDFMFFNGAILGIYINRIDVKQDERVQIAANYGREIGKMTLGMTMSESEIESDDYLMSLNFTQEQTAEQNYTPWYEGWTAVNETGVEPILNVALKEVEIEISNPVIKLAGKAGFVNYLIKVKGNKYYTTTEIGYIEMGKNIKIAMVPGELCTDLAYGGSSLTGEGSYSGEAFEGKTLKDIFGEDIIVFGLANDAIGYIVPDNDYCMCLAFGHYHETISLGKSTASTLMASFEELKGE